MFTNWNQIDEFTHYATKFTIHFKRYIVFYVPIFYCSFIANRHCHKELLVVMCSHEFLCFRCYIMPLRSLSQNIYSNYQWTNKKWGSTRRHSPKKKETISKVPMGSRPHIGSWALSTNENNWINSNKASQFFFILLRVYKASLFEYVLYILHVHKKILYIRPCACCGCITTFFIVISV